MTTAKQNRGEILNAEFFRAQAQTCRVQLMHTPLRERRYELQARAELYEDMADRLAKR
jgi:plasmid maintenance system antidote protein VapI